MIERVPGRVLVFTIRKFNRFFHEVAERTFEGSVTGCSFWPGMEAVNLQNRFYEYYRNKVSTTDLTDKDYEQIIKRCSVLRLLPWDQSKCMVDAMYRVIDELTDKVRPNYLLTVSVDSYVTDLLARICKTKGAQLLQMAAGIVDNTIILTSYGEFNQVRTPAEEEVTRALGLLSDDNGRVMYNLSVKQHSFWNQLTIWSQWWSKCMCFKAASWVLRDPLNLRFLMGTIPARDGQSSLGGYKAIRYFDSDWEERLARALRPAFFIPLSYFPEMSVSYWLKDLRYSDYENFIVETCRELSGTYVVVVKEHWSAIGTRHWPFYRRLKEIPGVVLVPPEINSRLVMQKVDRVLVGAGTTGIEAALRGKRVATLDRPYYFLENYYLNVGSADRIRQLPEMIESFKPPPNTEANRRRIVTRMLNSTLSGHLLPDGFIDTEENYQMTSESLKAYLSSTSSVSPC